MFKTEQRLPLIDIKLHLKFKEVCIEKRISMKEGAKKGLFWKMSGEVTIN